MQAYRAPLRGPETQHFSYVTSSTLLQKTSCMYMQFWKWASLHIRVVCFVDVTNRRQLSKPQTTVPDKRHNTQKNHVGSGRCWTIADDRVPRNGMLHSTLINASTFWHWYWDDAAFFTRELVLYLPFAAHAIRQLHLCLCVFFMDLLHDIVCTDPTFDQHASLWHFAHL